MINLGTTIGTELQEILVEELHAVELTNKDYNFTGGKNLRVYTETAGDITNYDKTAVEKYGPTKDIQNSYEEFTMEKDRATSFSIDKADNLDTPAGQMEITKAAARTIKEKGLPEINKYIYEKMVLNASIKKEIVLTKENIYETIVGLTLDLDNNATPQDRTIVLSNEAYSLCKLAKIFDVSSLTAEMIKSGFVGMIDGMPVKKQSRLMLGADILITVKRACTFALKIEDVNIHKNPPNLSGDLCQMRWYYTAFITELNKKNIAVVSKPVARAK